MPLIMKVLYNFRNVAKENYDYWGGWTNLYFINGQEYSENNNVINSRYEMVSNAPNNDTLIFAIILPPP